ncbi:FAD dependent oxidoreductase [Paenibacillus sp. UNCCL117]|uniref:FAD-dependent oxidoreductase n=1 Tax=unclassified Paenibacillus TaxID=185978 RepID=UPI00088A38A3|nr:MULTISPECIES: FAD-dependent oxidoreductase [unclassified Paenibacillus]SDD65209.1 FAD dependent oxidoreductase [Paenibacillus sp. cl123]SFW58169.1 FAD dependent oxidoreductase [Paenibacillus sp. UNCCL117]
MLQETIKSDITVVGAGLSGINAAIAAARLGQTVTLVHNRPVLGGNSSSEVRVWVCGATAHGTNRYARETGIMGELFVENQYRNIDGNPYFWDLVLLEAVRAESNIRLLLNTDVHEVEAEGDADDRRILSVTGWMMGSERRIRMESEIFLDCTGDGLIGFLAGAKYRIGREARSEYNEDWAPEVADDITLGSTLLFYTKDAGRPVKYHKPSFAIDITKTNIPLKRVIRSGDNGCAYWWIEWGGELDIVHDNERIRDELWAVIYGIWDYIKNSGNFDSQNMTLEWVGSLPGKREYRRFLGDYVLNQNDILAQRPFEDRVAFGGWSIDLHPPQGVYSTESGSKHLHADGIYHIPFRSLYSVNVGNLLFAGRNISATHVAFGTTRVMATCAVGGEAAGTGAALCVQKQVSPRTLHAEHLDELLQTLLRQDASIIGIASHDPLDLARQARVAASTTLSALAVAGSAGTYPLTSGDVALILPVDPALNGLELLIDAARETTLTVEAWDTGRGENYVPHALQASASATVAAGQEQWVRFDLVWQPEQAQNAFIIIRANEHAAVHLANGLQSGVLPLYRQKAHAAASTLEDHSPEQLVVKWSMRGKARQPFCFRLPAETGTAAYRPENVIDGYNRPYGGPHLWSSEELTAGKPEWLELRWSEPQQLGSVELIFNDDVNEDLINLHHHRTDFEVIPELVKDYRIEAEVDGQWQTLVAEQGNRKRKRVHTLNGPISSGALRLVVESTNGAPRAEVVEIRVYA